MRYNASCSLLLIILTESQHLPTSSCESESEAQTLIPLPEGGDCAGKGHLAQQNSKYFGLVGQIENGLRLLLSPSLATRGTVRGGGAVGVADGHFGNIILLSFCTMPCWSHPRWKGINIYLTARAGGDDSFSICQWRDYILDVGPDFATKQSPAISM